MTTLYLAYSIARPEATWADWDWDKYPVSHLISYVYLDNYLQKTAQLAMRPRNLMLDSGAYSAWASGKVIDIDALTEETKHPRYNEAVCLDVIGDGTGSLKNARYQKALGSPACPVFHFNEPLEILDAYVEEFPKVGLSCRFGEPINQSMNWLKKCFSRHWPFPYHSFGWMGEEMLNTFPFHSADASSWAVAPYKFGNWKSFGSGCSIRKNPPLTAEVHTYLRLEKQVKQRWKKELSRWPETINLMHPDLRSHSQPNSSARCQTNPPTASTPSHGRVVKLPSTSTVRNGLQGAQLRTPPTLDPSKLTTVRKISSPKQSR